MFSRQAPKARFRLLIMLNIAIFTLILSLRPGQGAAAGPAPSGVLPLASGIQTSGGAGNQNPSLDNATVVITAPPSPAVPTAAASTPKGSPAPRGVTTHAATPRPAATPAPRPESYTNRIIGPGVDTAVGVYSDCSGNTPLTTTEANLDTCVSWDRYFVGHHFPNGGGVFGGTMNWKVGTTVTYWDSHGAAHQLIIRGWQDESSFIAPRPPIQAAAQFQTCIYGSKDVERVFYATAA